MAKKRIINERGEPEYIDTETGERFGVAITPVVPGERTSGESQGVTQEERLVSPEYAGTSGRLTGIDRAIDFARELFRPGVTAAAGEIARQATKKAALPLRLGGPLGAAFLANYGAQQAQEAIPSFFGTPANFTPSMSRAAAEAIIDRVTGRGTEMMAAAPGLIRSTPKSRQQMIQKLSDVLPKAKTELQELGEAAKFAEKYDAPFPSIFGLGEGRLKDTLASAIGLKDRVAIRDKAAATFNKAWNDLIKAKQVTILSQREVAEELRKKGISAFQKAKNVENAAWKKMDAAADLSVQKVRYQIEKEVPSGLLDPSGNPLPPTKQLVDEFVDIKGPVVIDNVQDFAQILKSENAKLFQEPSEYFANNLPMQTAVNKIKSIVGNMAEIPPDMDTGKIITAFDNVKELRGALDYVAKHTSDSASKGAALKLRDMLTQATESSINNKGLNWFPGSRTAYLDANKATQMRVHRFGSDVGETFSTPKSVTNIDTYNTKIENELQSALKSSELTEQLVNATGAKEEVASAFINNGFRHAELPNGTYDGAKLADYFFDNPTNYSIFNNPNILNKDQRKIIRQLTSYAKSAKFSNAAGNIDWQYARIFNGILALGTGAGTGIITGSIPGGMAIGGAFAIGLPLTRNFFKEVLLDPEGGKLILQRLHPTSQQQAQNTTKAILKIIGRRGAAAPAEVYLLNQTGETFNGTVDENGKIHVTSP